MKKFIILTGAFFCSMLMCAQGLKEQIDDLVGHSPFLKSAETGICIYDKTANTYLYRYRDDKNARPASNQKLLTCVAALDLLGSTYPFTTTLFCDYLDNLYLEGGFDPEFSDEDMNELVYSVHDAGIKKLKGYLFGDVSLSDNKYWGPGWAWDDAAYSFQPKMSPLMFNKGCVSILATPRRDGGDNVSAYPESSYYTLTYKPSDAPFDVRRDWVDNKDVFYASGSTDTDRKITLTVSSSRDYFMHTFAERLLNSGVRARRLNWMLRKDIPFEYVERPKKNIIVLKSVSHSLEEVMDKCLKNSDNLNAEAILRNYAAYKIGKNKEVTAADGTSALRLFVSNKLGLNPDNYRFADGCGLSPYDQLSPYFLVQVLKYATTMVSYKAFYDALPVAGIDGTLSNRMRGTAAENNVRAKTGSLTGISSLSGYVTAGNGHQLIFSIMSRDVTAARDAKAFEDKLCVLLSNWK